MASDAHRPVVELVVLVASAGGLAALSTVLSDLPTDFPAAVVVQQHLGDHDSVLPAVLRRLSAQPVDWACDGQVLGPGQVLVCPPGSYLELAPGGRCRLFGIEDFGVRRFDVLLRSVAKSYGPRSAAAVLSGSGQDGAAGTAALRRAGAVVIAESPDTALYPSMPMAAARAGANLVLPIDQIGRALAGIVEGAPLPGPQPDNGNGACREPVAWEAVPPGGAELPRDEVVNTAAWRGELAGLRAAELGGRRRDLSAGSRATPQTVAMARRRAAESRRRAQLAHQAAEEAAARWGG
ncbi:chemotaxis protein CheB [Mycobacterium paraffinicum]|uniref:protein-glutamate methylesterase n=1 Tax=Mycobacterium paraffinicum TaxID=53378 RepID=A0ABP8RNJ8_9MYCO|nr:chemotaxis protein CheB [Mycobacterium paraffinicum]MCV7310369.1 chemotaxis protein CheB [Mycobacterium paraffinicum]